MSFKLTNTPNLEECSIVSKWIDHENKIHWPHMIPITAKELFSSIQHHGWLVARHENTWMVAGMVKLSQLHDDLGIYEWWSLFVMPQFRWRKLWHLLIRGIVEQFHRKSLLMVTNVPQVIQVSSHDPNQSEVTKERIWPKLLQVIEWPQPLLSNDRIFINQAMKKRIELIG